MERSNVISKCDDRVQQKNSSVEAKIPIDRQSWYNCVSLIKQIDRGIGENKELFNSKQSDCRHVFYVVMRK